MKHSLQRAVPRDELLDHVPPQMQGAVEVCRARLLDHERIDLVVFTGKGVVTTKEAMQAIEPSSVPGNFCLAIARHFTEEARTLLQENSILAVASCPEVVVFNDEREWKMRREWPTHK